MVTQGDAGEFQAVGEDELKVDVGLILEISTDANDDLVAKENEVQEHNRQQDAPVTADTVPSNLI